MQLKTETPIETAGHPLQGGIGYYMHYKAKPLFTVFCIAPFSL